MSIPLWFVPHGVGPFSVTLTPLTLQSEGGFSGGEEMSLTGVVDEIDIRSRNTVENISPMHQRQAHYVVVESETELRLVEILRRKGTNFLPSVGHLHDYARVVLTRGDQTWSFVGVVSRYEESIRKGKSVAVLVLLQVSVGETNPTYVSR